MRSQEHILSCTSSHLDQKAWYSSPRIITKYSSNISVSMVASSFSYCKFLVLGKRCFSIKHHLGKLVISVIYKPELASNIVTKNSKGINRKLQVFLHISLLKPLQVLKGVCSHSKWKGTHLVNTKMWPKPIELPLESPVGCKLLLYYFKN